MSKFTAVKVLKTSLLPNSEYIVTFQIIAPQIIHKELLRHRMFSFSVISMRAVGTKRIANDNLFIPTSVRYDERGMQGYTHLSDEDYALFEEWYLNAENTIVDIVNDCPVPVHKQTKNRLLEPLRYFQAIVTTTSSGLKNFFELRTAKDVEPDMYLLAIKMKNALLDSKFESIKWGQWHIPFESEIGTLEDKIKVSCTRSARTSYGLYENSRPMTFEEEIAFADKLVTDKHLSALEHCAMAVPQVKLFDDGTIIRTLFKNFYSAVPYRSFVEFDIPVVAEYSDVYLEMMDYSERAVFETLGFVKIDTGYFVANDLVVKMDGEQFILYDRNINLIAIAKYYDVDSRDHGIRYLVNIILAHRNKLE